MYKLGKLIYGEVRNVVRIEDNACIPFDEANTDYQAYLLWLEEGNSPYPADSATPEEAE